MAVIFFSNSYIKESAGFFKCTQFGRRIQYSAINEEKLGTEKDLREKLNGADPYEWARQYIEKLNLNLEEGYNILP